LQQSYIASAQHFQTRQDLYNKGSLEHVEAHYLYSPAFAFFFSPILLLPLQILLPLMVVIHILVYALLYIWWNRIFVQNNAVNVARQWAGLLPVYLVFSAFWDDLSYMNTYLLIALFATFLIDAILRENLFWASFWLGATILPIKPHWQFTLWYVVFALITLFWLRDTWVNSQQVQPIPYSEFVQHLKAGRVASVTVSNNLIEGKLKAPLPDGRTRVDPALAKELGQYDVRFEGTVENTFFRELLSYMLDDPSTVEPALDLILISRHLERIGDHATNIAEDVIFMVSALDVRHHTPNTPV
jgi:hypothetical protein